MTATPQGLSSSLTIDKAQDGSHVPSSDLLAQYGGTWDEFIQTCEEMASDIATKDPYGAERDGKRMATLIAMAKAWRGECRAPLSALQDILHTFHECGGGMVESQISLEELERYFGLIKDAE